MLANGNHLIGKIVNLNHENSISENFLGEEPNFPGFGPFGPSSWEISFLTSKIFGNIIFIKSQEAVKYERANSEKTLPQGTTETCKAVLQQYKWVSDTLKHDFANDYILVHYLQLFLTEVTTHE